MGADDQGLTLAIFRCIRPWNASNRGRHVVSIKLYPLITKVENKQLFKHFFFRLSALDQASNSCVFNWLIFSDILRKFSLYSWLTFSSIWPLFLTIQSIFRDLDTNTNWEREMDNIWQILTLSYIFFKLSCLAFFLGASRRSFALIVHSFYHNFFSLLWRNLHIIYSLAISYLAIWTPSWFEATYRFAQFPPK